MKTLRLLLCFILISNKAFSQIELNSLRAPLDISGHPKEKKINRKGYGEVTFIVKTSNDTLFYKGQFSKSLANGEGVFFLPWGDIYEGEFLDGLPNGYGVITFRNGDKYEGEFLDGLFHGQGVYTFGDGGEFAGDKYEGEHLNDKKHGYGVYTYANGDKYGGEYLDGEKHHILREGNMIDHLVELCEKKQKELLSKS